MRFNYWKPTTPPPGSQWISLLKLRVTQGTFVENYFQIGQGVLRKWLKFSFLFRMELLSFSNFILGPRIPGKVLSIWLSSFREVSYIDIHCIRKLDLLPGDRLFHRLQKMSWFILTVIQGIFVQLFSKQVKDFLGKEFEVFLFECHGNQTFFS